MISELECLFFSFPRQGLSVATKPVLELALKTMLDLNLQRSTCICLPNFGIKGIHCPANMAILMQDKNKFLSRNITKVKK